MSTYTGGWTIRILLTYLGNTNLLEQLDPQSARLNIVLTLTILKQQ